MLFCDIVESTRLAQQLDLDDWRELLHRYQDLCTGLISQHGGHLAQYLGDGVLCYFGYPVSHEDDGLRAVRTGLRLVVAVQELTRSLRQRFEVDLRVRVGIHTGLVVIGEIGTGVSRDRLALGVVPSLAARIQSVAEPDSVIISAATQSLVRGFVDCNEARQVELAGFSGPLALYRVFGETGAGSRVAAEARAGLPGLVGRNAELARLRELWCTATGGGGAKLLISGEPGIGKSRQIHTFKEQIASEAPRVIECRCSLDAQNSAFQPILSELERLHLGGKLAAPEKQAKLADLARSAGLNPAAVVPILGPLFALPLDAERYEPQAVSPLKAREITLESLLSLLLPPGSGPTLLVIEDLHWADASTLDLVSLALAAGNLPPALLILTARPGSDLSVSGLDSVPLLVLDRLDKTDSYELAKKVAADHPLTESTYTFIAERSDGIPLFVEELTKAIIETGVEGASVAALMPTTLRGLLAARLDRIAEAKPVAQLASALGREFSLELLQSVAPHERGDLASHLQRLVRSGLVVAVPEAASETYAFRHVLIRDAAYDSLLRQTRSTYHVRIADALVERFPSLVEARPEVVAEHYRLGEAGERSLRYFRLAGERALQTNAYREAVSHFKASLSQLAAESSERRRATELDLRSKLGMALIATEGYGSQNVEQNFARAAQLSGQLNAQLPDVTDRDRQFLANWGLWAFRIVRAEFAQANETTRQLELLATQPFDDGLRLEAHVSLGMNLLWSGADPAAAEREFLAALALHDVERHRDHPVRFSQDPKTISLAYLQWLCAMRGDVTRALSYLTQAEAHLQKNAHPYSEAFHAGHAAQLFYILGDSSACAEQARKAVQLSQQLGFPTWLATGGMFGGWCVAQDGRVIRGIEAVRANLGIWDLIQIALNGPTRLELLSRVQELGGELEGALGSVNKALEAAERTGELFYEPELHRRRGVLCARLGNAADAEAAYRRALGSACSRRAKLFELRAALALAQLLGRGSPDAERALQAALDGFDLDARLPELSEARKLLAS